MLDRKYLYHKLCIWDARNDLLFPIADRDEDQPKNKPEDCMCDACFYGKHELADALLSCMDERDELQDFLNQIPST